MAADDRQAAARRPDGGVDRQKRGGFLARLRGDRRGATAAAFGIMATVVIGMAGLATEAGRWYDIRRDAQNAADAGAIAGAVRLQYAAGALNISLANYTVNSTQQCGAQCLGKLAAAGVANCNLTLALTYINPALNNTAAYTGCSTPSDTTLTVNSPPQSGAYTGNQRAVEVIIRRNPPRLISGLFMTGATQEVYARGVAATLVVGPACVLGLSDSAGRGGVTFTGNTTVSAPNCIIASNSPANDSILASGSGTVNASTFYTLGGCSGCTSNNITLASPPVPNIATSDPFSWASSVSTSFLTTTVIGKFTDPTNQQVKAGWQPAAPAACSTSTTTCGINTSDWAISYLDYGGTSQSSAPFYVFRGNVSIGNGETLVLRSGTYFFVNGANLQVNGGNICISDTAATTCSSTLPDTLNTTPGYGVNLIFLKGTSGSAGSLTLTGGGIMSLQAKVDGPYAGLLAYRESATSTIPSNRTGNNGTDITINGNTTTRIAGGIYAPNTRATVTGNATMSTQGCLVLVAGDVVFQGSSAFTTRTCESGSTTTPQLRVVRLLE